MVKKLVALSGAAALLLGTAIPAFANYGRHRGGSLDLAIVENGALAGANTGGNSQGNAALIGGAGEVEETSVSGDNWMTTGDASAVAKAVVVANTHIGCGCERRGHNDVAIVRNGAAAVADTGYNSQGNVAVIGGYSNNESLGGGHRGHDEVEDTDVSGNNTLTTGAASATSKAFVLVNTHVDGLSW